MRGWAGRYLQHDGNEMRNAQNGADLEKVHLYNFGGCTIMRKRRQCILTPVLYQMGGNSRRLRQ